MSYWQANDSLFLKQTNCRAIMKQILKITVIALALIIVVQQNVSAQQTNDDGFTTFVKIELIVILIIIGSIFAALMKEPPEPTDQVCHEQIQSAVNPMSLNDTGIINDVKLEKLIRNGITGTLILMIFYLIIILFLLI